MTPVVLEYLNLDAPALMLPTNSLDAAEHERAGRFHFEEDRRRFVHGRAWLRLRLAELLGIEPAAVQFTTVGERGKPAIANPLAPPTANTARMRELAAPCNADESLLPTNTLPTFNLSHSAQQGLLAVHAGGLALGVDIEVARPFERAARIAARHFNAAESAAVASAPAGPEREAVFFRTWTRKEAYLKLTGLGLPGGLACVETGTEADARVLQVPPEHGLASAWVKSLQLPEALRKAIATGAASGAATGAVSGAATDLLAALAAPHELPLVWRTA